MCIIFTRISAHPQRPALVEGTGSAVIDFWVQLRGAPAGEFWLIEPRRPRPPQADASGHEPEFMPSRLHGLPTRQILQADLGSWEVPIANWGRILPYLTSHRRFRDALLEQSIVVFLLAAQTLDTVLERFGDHDATAVEAALFTLVAQGRVRSPDLAVAALSGRTRFQRI